MVTDRLIGYTLVGGTLTALSYYTIWVIGLVTDRLIGYTLVGGTLAALSYYTIWVIGLPFVDDDQEVILSWFPDHSLALALPLFAGILGLLCIGLYISAMMIKSKSKDHDD